MRRILPLLFILALTALCGCKPEDPIPAPKVSVPLPATNRNTLVPPASPPPQAAQDLPLPPGDGASAANELFEEGARLMGEGRIPQALGKYVAGLKLNSDDEEAHFNSGYLHNLLGKTNEAIAAYEACLRIVPDYTEARNNLGNLLRRAGRPDEAIPHFQAVLKQSPTNSSYHNNLATALSQKGLTAEAILHFEKAIEHNPRYLEANFNLASAYMQQGRTLDAKRQFERTLALDPNFIPARKALQRIAALGPR